MDGYRFVAPVLRTVVAMRSVQSQVPANISEVTRMGGATSGFSFIPHITKLMRATCCNSTDPRLAAAQSQYVHLP
jgi:hypothetical protein